MIPVHSNIGQEMTIHFERQVSWYEGKQLVPVYIKDNTFNFHLSKEVKSTEINIANNFQQSGNEYGRSKVRRKTLNTDLAPRGGSAT